MFDDDETINRPEAEGQSNAHRFGKFTVFERAYPTRDGNRFELYEVSKYLGKNDEGKSQYEYLRIPKHQSFGKQVELTPEQACRLAQGEAMEIELQRGESTTPASLFVSDVDTQSVQAANGKTYTNRTAKITTATHIMGQDGSHKGYSFWDGEANISTFHTVGNVRLGVQDCYDIAILSESVDIEGEVFSPGERVLYKAAEGNRKATYNQRIISDRMGKQKSSGVAV